MASPSKRAGLNRHEGDLSSMPLDALFEVLLRLPAKDLCRLRSVCRPWRALLSDPGFIDTHAARHHGPLIVAGYQPLHMDRSFLFEILDLSGRIIKQFRKIEGPQSFELLTCNQRDFVCIEKGIREEYALLNPATGSLFALPEGYAEGHWLEARYPLLRQVIAFGQVASTGQYKVLRLIQRDSHLEQLCEVFTFNRSIPARWREKRAPPGPVSLQNYSRIVNKGIAYFLVDEFAPGRDLESIRIALFDLAAEDWRTTFQGPMIGFHMGYYGLSLTSLNDCLVLVRFIKFHEATMDLWYLMDFERGLWVKRHSIKHQLRFQQHEFSIHPFFMLSDGRILTYIGDRGLLRIYNPRTSTFTNVADIGLRGTIGLYTGNLLSLASNAGLSDNNVI